MNSIKLQRLPDRTPVKVTLSLTPELHQALTDYAALYNEVYGQSESLQGLMPAMLASFIEGDRPFIRRRRGQRA